DHGNSDEMELKSGKEMVVSTQHSLNPVPFWLLGKEVKLKEKGIVPDVGVTVLSLMGLKKPADMTAQSLLA
ncbi:MAG: 2,3-bisphosphoglycerate-independent phosphoglycerate mutase, partial [Candidatus Margulisiibacteriota bacterium]